MRKEEFSRTRLLMGNAALETLWTSRVAVFGVGGVGGYAVEALARSGVGSISLFDNDRVSLSNINRQIIATHSTVGQLKVDVAKQRILDISPDCEVKAHPMFYLPENADEVDLSAYDYVVDCVDTVKAKMELIRRCHAMHIPLISCMGAANKMQANAFKVADLSETHMDPLSKVLRKKLRKEGIEHVKVVYSDEEPLRPMYPPVPDAEGNIKIIPASNAFVPASAGLLIGGEVIKDLIAKAGTWRKEENPDGKQEKKELLG